jgi:hypothetical protein
LDSGSSFPHNTELNEDLITNMFMRYGQISLPRRDAFRDIVSLCASRIGIAEVPL